MVATATPTAPSPGEPDQKDQRGDAHPSPREHRCGLLTANGDQDLVDHGVRDGKQGTTDRQVAHQRHGAVPLVAQQHGDQVRGDRRHTGTDRQREQGHGAEDLAVHRRQPFAILGELGVVREQSTAHGLDDLLSEQRGKAVRHGEAAHDRGIPDAADDELR
ncbi:MAG: hypothetical protein U5K33_06735 [Halofilum sp. (in: g-proteobacteria)]|nr:hypothetical protein [Halofilum sp. (in: g-proteobacteria)]